MAVGLVWGEQWRAPRAGSTPRAFCASSLSTGFTSCLPFAVGCGCDWSETVRCSGAGGGLLLPMPKKSNGDALAEALKPNSSANVAPAEVAARERVSD